MSRAREGMAHYMLLRPDSVQSHVLFQGLHLKKDTDKLEYVLQRMIVSHENLLEDMMRFWPGKENIALNEYLFKDFM